MISINYLENEYDCKIKNITNEDNSKGFEIVLNKTNEIKNSFNSTLARLEDNLKYWLS